MNGERELERRLRELRVPGEHEAERRSWEVVRAAHAEREPARPAPRAGRRITVALAAAGAVLAVGLSPAGAKVADLADEMAEAVGIGAEDAKPALRSLPAAGELLVESAQGSWIVREDGSKRLLGDYDEASWSPRGLFVAVAEGRELLAVEPDGDVRWSIQAPGPVRDPRWGGIGLDTRIAYRSGDDLWVVDGDGSDQRLVARDIARAPAAWRPTPTDLKLDPAAGPVHVLTYVDGSGEIRTINAETGERLETETVDMEALGAPAAGGVKGALSPDGRHLATIRPAGRRAELVLDRARGAGRVLFSARGRLTGPTWSPDGRWLLVGWPQADQWLFIPAERRGRIVAIDEISAQFDPGDSGERSFPLVEGWILPQR